jgi:hypothetical protein
MHSFVRSSTATAVKDLQQSPTQWVEIIEPKSKEKMYANLQTGSCVWDAPEVRFVIKLLLFQQTKKARSQHKNSQLNEIIIITTTTVN